MPPSSWRTHRLLGLVLWAPLCTSPAYHKLFLHVVRVRLKLVGKERRLKTSGGAPTLGNTKLRSFFYNKQPTNYVCFGDVHVPSGSLPPAADKELLRIPPPPRRRLCLLAKPRRGIEGGRRSSAWGGERERLMEDKAGVGIIYKDNAKTFRLPRKRSKISANHRRFQTKTVCDELILQTVHIKNRLWLCDFTMTWNA